MRRRSFLLLSVPAALRAQDPVPASSVGKLHELIRAARPGDTIVMGNGNWANADILFEASGTPQDPIRLQAETPGQVTLTGRSRLRIAGRHLVVDGLLFREGWAEPDVISFRANSMRLASHCRVTRCAILDYSPPEATRDTKWVGIYGYRNRVDRCYFAGKTNLGTTLVVWLPTSGEPNHHWIEHNHFGPRSLLGVNGAETIRVGDSNTSLQSSMSVIEFNYFDRCNGEIEIISNKSCENIYRWNVFEQCEGTLTLRHGNRCVVEGNSFFGRNRPQSGGVRVIGEDHRVLNNYFEGLAGTGNRSAIVLLNGIPDSPLNGYFQVRRALIAHNTTFQCARPLTVGHSEGRTMPPEQCLLVGNLFSGSRSPLVDLADPRSGVEWESNLFHGAPTGLDGVAEAAVTLGPGMDDYWLPAAGSVAQGGVARELAEVREDLLGRPRSRPADIGCLQIEAGDSPRRRLGVSDTGPDWLDR